MDDGSKKIFSDIIAMKLVTQNQHFREGNCSQEILTPKKALLLKKQLFQRSAYFEQVQILNYVF